MSEERNVLYNQAYPELRGFCNDVGVEFQVIDMRWGVRGTAVVDHSIASLCLFEVQTCKRLSIGPNFVVLFGNRYGYQPLPISISDEDFEMLTIICNSEGLDADGMLDTWYKLDNNSIPSSRVLEPITTDFSHYENATAELSEKRQHGKVDWNKVYEHLSTILRKAESLASKHGYSTGRIRNIFSKSITQMEVDEALQDYKGSGFFAYSRDISDLHKLSTHQNAGRYIDLDESHTHIDKTRQKMLKSLKNSVDNNVSIKKQHKKYRIKWKDIEEGESGGYLTNFCSDFVKDMKKSIAECVAQRMRQRNFTETTNDALLDEVIHHTRFQYAKIVDFRGRVELIDSIMAVIEKMENHQPIVIFGQSGCGKTALMGKFIEVSNNRMPESIIIYRFLGTSPESSSIHNLLKNLIAHISRVFQIEMPASHALQSFVDVADHFKVLLQKASSVLNGKDRLLIFLDSIDQLSTEDGAHRMTWLPKSMPNGVSIIISSLPEPDFDIVPIMRKNISESNCYHVQGLTTKTADEVMNNCLGSVKRKLTPPQTHKILEAFERSPYPLFLKLILEDAMRWRSHFDVTRIILPNSSRDAVSMFYHRLEREHGTTIVSHVLGFLVAARDGITENEMLDLLSLDNDVLYEAYEHWSPPTSDTARLPAFTWTRLNHDLSNYLVRRQAGNHTVLALYHRQFVEVAREKYLNSPNAFKIYDILKEYFLGTYSNEINKKLKLNMWDEEKEVNRRVANQPLKFSTEIFNVRKLRELPYCLLKGDFIHELKENVLSNPEWITIKSAAFSIKDVVEDYDMYLSKYQDLEIRLIRDAIKLAKPTLEFPGARNHFCIELYCRLKSFEQQFPDYLGTLVSESQKILENCQSEIFLPQNSAFQSPGGPLRATITGFKTPVTCLAFSKQLDTFAAGSNDGCLLVWDCKNDETLQRIDASSCAISAIAFSELEDKLASISQEGDVAIFDIDTGNQRFHTMTVDVGNAKLFFSEENIIVVSDKMVSSWNFLTQIQNYATQIETTVTCSLMCNREDGRRILLGLKDGTYLCLSADTGEQLSNTKSAVCSPVCDVFQTTFHGDVALIWQNGRVDVEDILTGETKHSISVTEKKIHHCSLSQSGQRLAFASERDVWICSIDHKIECEHVLKNQSEKIRNIGFVRNDHLAVAYEDRKVIVWNVTNEATPKASSKWEGTGASIDYMAIGDNVGVTASSEVFYLKVWDLDEDDDLELVPSLFLRRHSTDISRDGQYIAYQEGAELVAQKISDFITGDRSVSTLSLDNSRNISALKFFGRDLLVIYEHGLLCKLLGNSTANDSLVFTDQNFLQLPLDPVGDLSVSPVDNEKVLLVATDTKKNHIFFIVDMTTFSNEPPIIASRRDISSDISALVIDSTDGIKAFVGTTSGELLCLELDASARSVRVASCQRKHRGAITCVAISTSTKYLFTGSTGRTRRLWELNGTAVKLKHELHFESLLGGGVTTAQFVSNDDFLISGSKERSITVWSTHSGTLIGTMYVYAPVLDLVVAESNTLIYTSELGYVGVAQFRAPTRRINGIENRSSRSCNIM